jgi:DNA-binding NarL/FixJ family response regulator
MDILQLVAQGLSNGDIARRLVLSPRTVETHVANLLAKTGADGRAGLTSLAQSVRQEAAGRAESEPPDPSDLAARS